MATNVVMEALSPTMEEGRLVEWKKREGDAVAVGDVLAEVETDKAVMELVARAGGTLLRQVVPAGTTVPVSELVAVIGEPGEAAPAAPPSQDKAGGAKPAPAPAQTQATQPTPGKNRPESMPPAPAASAATEARSGAPAPTSAGNGHASVESRRRPTFKMRTEWGGDAIAWSRARASLQPSVRTRGD